MYINRAQFVSYIIHTATLYVRSTLLLDAGSRGVSYVSSPPTWAGGGGGGGRASSQFHPNRTEGIDIRFNQSGGGFS